MTGIHSKHTVALKLGNRIKFALGLLCVGLLGLGIVGVFMYQKAQTVDELSTHANRGVVNNVSEILQIPAMMFFAILAAYAVSELYKSYKIMNDPETYRKRSSERVGISAERKMRREKKTQKRQTATRQSRRQITDQSKAQRPRQITDQSRDRSVGLSASQIPKPPSKSSNGDRTRRGRLR